MQTIISGGRDYFLQTVGSGFTGYADIGTGTTVQMLATTGNFQTGVGFWAIDTGNWNQHPGAQQGTLFTWQGTVSGWHSYYAPYTYPHPRRGYNASGSSTFYTYRRLGWNPKFSVFSLY